MTTKPKQNKQHQTKKHDWSFYAIIVCLIILAIPVGFIGVQGLLAMREGKQPILGDRFDNQFDNVITKEKIATIESQIGNIDGIETIGSTLITGTYRLAIQVSSDASKDTISKLAASAYDAVVAELPVEQYFKEGDGFQRYDLEIAVHNGAFDDESKYILLIGTKNAGMDVISYQFVTTPLSESWVKELWDRQEEKDKAKNNVNSNEEVAPDTDAAPEEDTD